MGLSPRLRGNPPPVAPRWPRPGLSPRLRGNLAVAGAVTATAGSIPALAGNRDCFESWVRSWRSIPALAGEPGPRPMELQNQKGSIPALAGEPLFLSARAVIPRVYPRACGGTWCRESPFHSQRVYPRACGGTYTLLNIIAGVAGLSPRLRGNLQSKHSVS